MEKKKHIKESEPVVAPPDLINTWKEFYDLLPEKFHSSWNEKCYRKLFSLAVRNGCKVFSHKSENKVTFRQHAEGSNFILFSEFTHLSENSKFTAVPSKVLLSNVECISTGYKFIFRDCIQAYCNSQGDYFLASNHRFPVGIIEKELKDVVWAGTKHELDDKYYHNKEFRRELSWNDALSNSVYLVLKDHLWYKRGQILDVYYNNREYYKRSPMSFFVGSYGHSVYSIGNESIACDLNLVTLNQLEAIDTNTFSCSKKQFGCQRGCTSYCYAEGGNKRDTQRKQYLIKLYKELNLGNR